MDLQVAVRNFRKLDYIEEVCCAKKEWSVLFAVFMLYISYYWIQRGFEKLSLRYSTKGVKMA